jgi:hypothetical protein
MHKDRGVPRPCASLVFDRRKEASKTGGAVRPRRLSDPSRDPGLLPWSVWSPQKEMRTDARCARIGRGPWGRSRMILASVVKGQSFAATPLRSPRSIAGIAPLRATGKPAALRAQSVCPGQEWKNGALRARRLIRQNPGIPGLLPESWCGSPEEEMRTDARCARIGRGA